MKLLIQNSARVWGGNEKWTALVAEGLRARGHEVVVSCRRGGALGRVLEARGVRVSHARPGVGADLVRALAFARLVRRERPDAVLLTSWQPTFWGAWAARVAGVRQVAVRLGIARTPRRGATAFALRRWVDALIVNSPEIHDGWRSGAPWFPVERIHVVLNGVPPTIVDRASAGERLRREVRVGAGTLIVGGAGHVHTRKGFDVLLEAFSRAALPEARLVLAGGGPEVEPLRRRSAELGVAERVHWLGHRDDVEQVLAGCDVFVLSSRNEGMANVMLEAMAVGTPVIAADVSGVRTALDGDGGEPQAGWIVPREDAGALASTLREVASLVRDEPATARKRPANARQRVEDRFGVERMVGEVEAVLFRGLG